MRISDWSSDVCSSDLQIAFAPALFAELVPWLALNRGGLTIFLHPETGDPLPDHRDHDIWLGEKAELDLAGLDWATVTPAEPFEGSPRWLTNRYARTRSRRPAPSEGHRGDGGRRARKHQTLKPK